MNYENYCKTEITHFEHCILSQIFLSKIILRLLHLSDNLEGVSCIYLILFLCGVNRSSKPRNVKFLDGYVLKVLYGFICSLLVTCRFSTSPFILTPFINKASGENTIVEIYKEIKLPRF